MKLDTQPFGWCLLSWEKDKKEKAPTTYSLQCLCEGRRLMRSESLAEEKARLIHVWSPAVEPGSDATCAELLGRGGRTASNRVRVTPRCLGVITVVRTRCVATISTPIWTGSCVLRARTPPSPSHYFKLISASLVSISFQHAAGLNNLCEIEIISYTLRWWWCEKQAH